MLKNLLMGMMLVVLAGCNLENPNATPTALPPSPQQEDSSNQPETQIETTPECVIRTDWPVYIVQPGDILTLIADATGSTIAELTEANCLTNPDNLDRGQELRVPRLPDDQQNTDANG